MAQNRRLMECFNPATGEKLCDPIPALTKEEVLDVVARARAAQREWAKTSFKERRAVLGELLQVIVDNQEEITSLSCRETGKTMVEAQLGEIITTCEKIRYTMKRGEQILRPESREVPLLLMTKKARVEFHPLGVMAAIIPWNYPFHNAYSPMIASLMAGNACVVKASEFASWSAAPMARYIKDVLSRRGHNPDLVEIIVGDGLTGAALVNAGVDKIIFIGSPQVGQRVMRAAADTLTPVVLELGGKDPMIVCDDADWKQVVQYALRGAFINCGQNCVAAERLYVHESVYDKFVAEAVEVAKKLRQGFTLTGTVDCGAITMPSQVDKIEELVKDAVAHGAVAAVGGRRHSGASNKGSFFQPTILTNVTHDMRIVKEETFGPVMLVIKWSTDEEVIEYANSTEYGLSSTVFTTNYRRAEAMSQQLVAGSTTINDFGVPYLIQSLPFGGVKISGFGKFNGPEGLRGCCREKAVVTDRFPVRTALPSFMHYPTPEGTPQLLRDAVSMIYGSGVWNRMCAAGRFLKRLVFGTKPAQGAEAASGDGASSSAAAAAGSGSRKAKQQ